MAAAVCHNALGRISLNEMGSPFSTDSGNLDRRLFSDLLLWLPFCCSEFHGRISNHPDTAGRSIILDPTEELVLAADAPHCDDVDENGNRMDVPDAPLRATRWQGNILAIAAHYNNLVYSSDALQTLRRRDCNSVLKSEKNPDPAQFADREWLVSPYASNNRLFGLVHNEYWGALHNEDCKRRLGHRPPWASVCLYGNLTGVVSNDTQSFHRIGVVAAYPYTFPQT